MQSQKGNIGSFPETRDFVNGSTSSNVDTEQQIICNNLRTPAEEQLQSYILPTREPNLNYANSTCHYEHNLSRWNFNGPSSSNFQQDEMGRDEPKREHVWSSSLLNSAISDTDSEQPPEATDFLSNSTSDDASQTVNINSRPSGGSVSEGIPYSSGSSDILGSSSRSRQHLIEDDGRLSCKRKVFEGNIGQTSSSTDRSLMIQHAGSSSSSRHSAPSDNVLRASPLDEESTENSRRNSRMRVNPLHYQECAPLPSSFSRASGSNGNLNVPSPIPTFRFFPLNHSSPDSGLAQSIDDTIYQTQSHVARGPNLQHNVHPFRWPESMDNVPNSFEHPAFENPTNRLRITGQNQRNWNLQGGNVSIPGNVASSSRNVSNRARHRSQYQQRFSEVRNSLLNSSGSESGRQSGHISPLYVGPASSNVGNLDSHRFHARSVLLGRQGDGVFGLPISMRNVPSFSEGRIRFASEIRNVLELVRRGEAVGLEDRLMIFDHPAFLAAADAHDRHRDMRVDVDNMSYEELLDLEELIGNVNTGLSDDSIFKLLEQRSYSCIAPGDELHGEPCCICQEKYNEGEEVGKLDCGHEFHTACIKQWLKHKNLCPICKTTGLKDN